MTNMAARCEFDKNFQLYLNINMDDDVYMLHTEYKIKH